MSSQISSSYNNFLTIGQDLHSSQQSIKDSLDEFRHDLLVHGGLLTLSCPARSTIWQLLMNCSIITKDQQTNYFSLLSRGHCSSTIYTKIRGDSFRTFSSETIYREKVSEKSLIRVLNSFVLSTTKFSYSQGLNTLCGVFLYVMNECSAYYCFYELLHSQIPLYYTDSHFGAESACYLIMECLDSLDNELYQHLSQSAFSCHSAFFHCVSSLSSSIRPFEQVLQLWDILLLIGVHWNILCIAAMCVLNRKQLLQTSHPSTILNYRKWPLLNAKQTIQLAISFIHRLPDHLHQKIEHHAKDYKVAKQINQSNNQH